jgi:hypothetical protein
MSNKDLFIERRPQGDFAVRRATSSICALTIRCGAFFAGIAVPIVGSRADKITSLGSFALANTGSPSSFRS